jgi:hypothetical protein
MLPPTTYGFDLISPTEEFTCYWNEIPSPKPLQELYPQLQQDIIELPQEVSKVKRPPQNSTSTESTLLSKKKSFTKYKERSNLPTRCSNVNCDQHYSTHEEAMNHKDNFITLKGKNTVCPCGNPLQYWFMDIWMSSTTLSKYSSKNKK